jgi:hypothetical protein
MIGVIVHGSHDRMTVDRDRSNFFDGSLSVPSIVVGHVPSFKGALAKSQFLVII